MSSNSPNGISFLRLGLDKDPNPPSDEALEQHLSVLEVMSEKYLTPEKELQVYTLSTEDALSCVQAYNGLKAELTTRGQDFRRKTLASPLYSDSLKDKIIEVLDSILNMKGDRLRSRANLFDEEILSNPYKTSVVYLEAILDPFLFKEEIQPEIFKIAIDTVRGFDLNGKSRLKHIP